MSLSCQFSFSSAVHTQWRKPHTQLMDYSPHIKNRKEKLLGEEMKKNNAALFIRCKRYLIVTVRSVLTSLLHPSQGNIAFYRCYSTVHRTKTLLQRVGTYRDTLPASQTKLTGFHNCARCRPRSVCVLPSVHLCISHSSVTSKRSAQNRAIASTRSTNDVPVSA